MLTVIQGALRSWTLAGVVTRALASRMIRNSRLKGSKFSEPAGAHLLKPDGQLDTALWHGLGGHNHVEP